MDDDNFEYLAIRTEPEQYSGRIEEPSDYIHTIDGKVVWLNESGRVSREVGEFSCTLIDADAADLHGVSPFDVYDTTQATYDLFAALFDDLGGSAKVNKALGGHLALWSHNLLLIDRLVIYPSFRGQKLGLRALTMLLQRYQSIAEVAVLKPFPLQFEGGMAAEEAGRLGLKGFTCTMNYATRRLNRYYAELGFASCRGTGLMVRAADKALPPQTRFT